MSLINSAFRDNGYKVAMMRLRDILGREAGKLILEEEGRQIINDTIKTDNRLAVLQKLAAFKAANGTGKGFGETAITVRNQAVEFWIRHAIGTINVESFREPRVKKRFEEAIRSGNYESLNAWLRKIDGPLKNKVVGPFDRRIYDQALNRRSGKTYGRGNHHVADKPSIEKLAAFIKRKVDNVGLKFAGFLAGARALGLRLPAYAERHGNAPGSFQLQETTGDVKLTITNLANFDRKMIERTNYVIRQREGKIKTKLARIARGEATNLGFGTYEKSGGLTMREVKANRLKQVT